MGTISSRDIYMQLELHCCQELNSPSQFRSALDHVISTGGLIPLSKDRVQVAENKFASSPVDDLDGYFQQYFQTNADWDRMDYSSIKPEHSLSIRLRTTFEREWMDLKPVFGAQEISFNASRYSDQYNLVTLSCTLFGKMVAFPEKPPEHIHADRTADLFRRIALALIPVVMPQYTIITDNEYGVTYGSDVLNSKLEHIHWCNYFGPLYVDKYGEKIFLNAPGSRVERLAEGVWCQLTKQFEQYRNENVGISVKKHFQSLGVEMVNLVDYSPGQ